MTIHYGHLHSLTARQLIAALIQDGFVLDRQSGSHQIYYRHADKRRVTVSFHKPGDTFPPKPLKHMPEHQAGWQEADLQRLGLLK
jgi:predicted RNA binding protein YcfA (HicA-like mRNA interferase family)